MAGESCLLRICTGLFFCAQPVKNNPVSLNSETWERQRAARLISWGRSTSRTKGPFGGAGPTAAPATWADCYRRTRQSQRLCSPPQPYEQAPCAAHKVHTLKMQISWTAVSYLVFSFACLFIWLFVYVCFIVKICCSGSFFQWVPEIRSEKQENYHDWQRNGKPHVAPRWIQATVKLFHFTSGLELSAVPQCHHTVQRHHVIPKHVKYWPNYGPQ